MSEVQIQDAAPPTGAGRAGDRLRWLFPLALIVLCSVLYFWRLGVTPLEDFDEAYYAEGAREMLARADLGTPYFNGQPFLLKPALIYWIIAAAFHTLGPTEFAARVSSAFLGTLLVLVTYWFASRLLSRRAGLFAGVALALNFMWIDIARDASIDVPLCAALVPAVFLCYLGTQAVERKWRFYLPAYPLFGVALLAKGPVPTGIVMVGCLAYLVAARRLAATLREAYLLPGIALLLLVAAPWYAYELRVHPEFWRIFFIGEHFGHVSGTLARNEPVWGNLKYLLVYFLPWAAFLPAAFLHAFRQGRTSALRLCAWWSLAVIGVFSIPHSKLAHYLAPAFPPLAVLVGAWLDAWLAGRTRERTSVWAAWGLLGLVAVLCAFGAVLAGVYPPALAKAVAAQNGPWTPGPALTVVLASLAAGFLSALVAARRRPGWMVPLLSAGVLAAGLCYVGWFKPHWTLIQAQPRKELAMHAARLLPHSEPLGVYYAKRNSTIFYLARPIVDLGEWEPARLAAFLNSLHPAAALTHVKFVTTLREANVPFDVVEQRGEYVLLRNRRLGPRT